jgi:hypothetical protein
MRSDARAANVEMAVFIKVSHYHIVVLISSCGANVGKPASLSVSQPCPDPTWAIDSGGSSDQIWVPVCVDVICTDSMKFLRLGWRLASFPALPAMIKPNLGPGIIPQHTQGKIRSSVGVKIGKSNGADLSLDR